MNKFLEKIASWEELEKEAYIKGFMANRKAMRQVLEEEGHTIENRAFHARTLAYMRNNAKGKRVELEPGYMKHFIRASREDGGMLKKNSPAQKRLEKEWPKSFESTLTLLGKN